MRHTPIDGFWQVEYDDPHDEFVDVGNTNVSLRRTAFTVYADGRFLQIRTDSGRRPPTTWPPSEAERVSLFRSSTASAGRFRYDQNADDAAAHTGAVAHTVTMAPDPRDVGARFDCAVTIDGDTAEVRGTDPHGASVHERWRRLSRRGATPLAGAWASGDDDDRWMLLVTAGHYGVVHSKAVSVELPETGELGDADVLAVFESFGSNAGAIVQTATSFDNHPFVASNSSGYEARKHESFFLSSVESDRLMIGFEDDGSDALPWTRLD
ncbi:lipocalin-like domain-containing protein [Humibacter ginsenosidimutans]|uniref:lipocalin-like domain-containing protein n=1 Tax=Humibacter ginsenosidimutans TaxID=2599293 RepID=UPI00143DB830|nr:lipocalin-like domain-containing protein [Humibacter ginsenosidimutans]